MRIQVYLVVEGKKPRNAPAAKYRAVGAVRVTKTKPSLTADEIAIELNLEIPDALFMKPSLVANITVPQSEALNSEIPCEVLDNIVQSIQELSGMSVTLRVGKNDE